MSIDQIKVKSHVFMGGQMNEFETVGDALAFAGGSISEELAAIINEQSTFFIVESEDEDPPEGLIQEIANAPPAHRHLCALAGMAFALTYSSRHPVLAIDAGEHLVMVVTQAHRIEAFVKRRYKQTIPLKNPPANKWSRWVISIAKDETCARTSVALEPRPGVAQA